MYIALGGRTRQGRLAPNGHRRGPRKPILCLSETQQQTFTAVRGRASIRARAPINNRAHGEDCHCQHNGDDAASEASRPHVVMWRALVLPKRPTISRYSKQETRSKKQGGRSKEAEAISRGSIAPLCIVPSCFLILDSCWLLLLLDLLLPEKVQRAASNGTVPNRFSNRQFTIPCSGPGPIPTRPSLPA